MTCTFTCNILSVKLSSQNNYCCNYAQLVVPLRGLCGSHCRCYRSGGRCVILGSSRAQCSTVARCMTLGARLRQRGVGAQQQRERVALVTPAHWTWHQPQHQQGLSTVAVNVQAVVLIVVVVVQRCRAVPVQQKLHCAAHAESSCWSPRPPKSHIHPFG